MGVSGAAPLDLLFALYTAGMKDFFTIYTHRRQAFRPSFLPIPAVWLEFELMVTGKAGIVKGLAAVQCDEAPPYREAAHSL